MVRVGRRTDELDQLRTTVDYSRASTFSLDSGLLYLNLDKSTLRPPTSLVNRKLRRTLSVMT